MDDLRWAEGAVPPLSCVKENRPLVTPSLEFRHAIRYNLICSAAATHHFVPAWAFPAAQIEDKGQTIMKIKKKELLFFLIVIAAALIWWAVMSANRASVDHGSVRITVAGEEYGVYSLGKDQKIKINDHNTCRIKNGKAKMIEANCPDHLCIHQEAIDERGGFIICLPNQVVIEAIPSENAQETNGLDAVS